MLEELWRDAPKGARVFVGPLHGKANLAIRDALERATALEGTPDQFFSPSLLTGEEGRSKASFLASHCLWVDYDADPVPAVAEVIRRCTLPPSYVVATGGGYHLYWLLNDLTKDQDQVERANQALTQDVGGDSCWDVTRVLRLPATLHAKRQDFEVKIVQESPAYHYAMSDVLALERVGKKTRHKIRTGDSRGYASRSERDLAIVGALLRAGVSTELIEHLFQHHACGDRYREEGKRGREYLRLTGAKVAHDKQREMEKAPSFEEEEDGLYYNRGKSRYHVATFNYAPERLLNIIGEDTQAIMGTMTTEHGAWPEVVLPREAFNSVRALMKYLTRVTWQWLGSDKVVREFLPYLVKKLVEAGAPTTAATTVLGYSEVGPCYVFDSWTMTRDGLVSGRGRPVMFLDTGKEHPHYYGRRTLSEGAIVELRGRVAELLPRINKPEVVLSALGWFYATPWKVQLRSAYGYKFPTLDVFGTRGSGKTTLIQNVMLPLLGVCAEGGAPAVSYDANTTRFVTLALLGGSNCVPISFSEFRESAVSGFLRYILLAYDSGRDPRGRADQTTVNYPLTAPFVMDGEDRISDPAGVERTVAIGLAPNTIAEGSDAALAYTELSKLPLPELAEDVYRYCLTADLGKLLPIAERIVADVIPETLPDRIRRNFVVCAVGLLTAQSCGVLAKPIPWEALRGPALSAVIERGRTLVSADAFIEEVANEAGSPRATFPHILQESVLRFQFTPAYNWWCARLRRRGVQSSLALSSIRRQLTELMAEADTYILPPERIKGRIMWGVHLGEAQKAGLDVPEGGAKGPKLKVNLPTTSEPKGESK